MTFAYKAVFYMGLGNVLFGNVFSNAFYQTKVLPFSLAIDPFFMGMTFRRKISATKHTHISNCFANIAGEHHSQHTKQIADIIFALYSHN